MPACSFLPAVSAESNLKVRQKVCILVTSPAAASFGCNLAIEVFGRADSLRWIFFAVALQQDVGEARDLAQGYLDPPFVFESVEVAVESVDENVAKC